MVYPPLLQNMSSSIGMMKLPRKNHPVMFQENHQPVLDWFYPSGLVSPTPAAQEVWLRCSGWAFSWTDSPWQFEAKIFVNGNPQKEIKMGLLVLGVAIFYHIDLLIVSWMCLDVSWSLFEWDVSVHFLWHDSTYHTDHNQFFPFELMAYKDWPFGNCIIFGDTKDCHFFSHSSYSYI